VRKLIVVGVLTALSAAVLAVPASASFDRHFSVLSREQSHHQRGDTIHFKDRLLDPRKPRNRVGGDRGRCTSTPRRNKSFCHVVLRLNGEIGGKGHISLSGRLGGHDNRLNVTGGDGDFHGVAGKMLLTGGGGPRTGKLHFDLVR
jgi:hypothetical protein